MIPSTIPNPQPALKMVPQPYTRAGGRATSFPPMCATFIGSWGNSRVPHRRAQRQLRDRLRTIARSGILSRISVQGLGPGILIQNVSRMANQCIAGEIFQSEKRIARTDALAWMVVSSSFLGNFPRDNPLREEEITCYTLARQSVRQPFSRRPSASVALIYARDHCVLRNLPRLRCLLSADSFDFGQASHLEQRMAHQDEKRPPRR